MRKQTWKWAISTLGCPELNLAQVRDLARANGIEGIELRALEQSLHLPEYFEKLGLTAEQISSEWRDYGLEVNVMDSSARLAGGKPEAWDELWSLADWADKLQIPYLRVFDGGEDESDPNPQAVAELIQRANLWSEAKVGHGWTCDILVETHWALIHPDNALRFVEATDGRIGLIWDAFHTWRKSPLLPSDVWVLLAPHVRHVHFKDAAKSPNSTKGAIPCTFGKGEFPFSDLLQCLSDAAYSGHLCLEWERFWNPEADSLAVNLDNLLRYLNHEI